MSLDLDSIEFLDLLWDHQVEAIAMINSYVEKEDEDWDESCMIALPTGVGKTGIIATYAHFSDFENILILSPRTNITSQNFDNIEGGFFRKLGIDLDSLKETVKKMSLGDQLSEKVIVSTIQKVGDMFRREKNGKAPPRGECEFSELKNIVDLLIIDEGHWEPADTWKDFLRQFDCPKILFTATPIRNDYSHFNVRKYGYLYTKPISYFQEENYLKNVEFIEVEKKDTIEDFISHIKSLIRSNPQEINKKILVRCENSVEIRFLVEAFGNAYPNKSVIGIHVNFPTSQEEGNRFLTNKTPISDEDKDRFDIWIHQYKMVEGFDEPRFGYLLLFSPFSNVRQLVQQVGRILRNPDRGDGEVGYVLSPIYGRQEELWENYLVYDDKDDDEKAEVLNTMDFDYTTKIFNDIDLVYLDKLFRKKFDKESEPFDVDERFKLPLSCNVKKRLGEKSNLESIYSSTVNDFLSVNVDVLFSNNYEDNSFVVYYLEVNNSPFIKYEQVVETKTNIIYFRELQEHFVFYSSSTSFLQFFDDLGVSSNISPTGMKKLIASSERSRISNVYLKNSAVSSVQYSSKKLWANDISKVAPSFDDSFHTLSNLWGFSYGDRSSPKKEVLVPLIPDPTEETARRYLGQKSGRVTQDGSVRYNIEEFNEWSDKVVEIIESPEEGHDLFRRFAEEVDAPEEVEPYLIAFDFDLMINYFSGKVVKVDSESEFSENQLFSMSNHCFEVNEECEFIVQHESLSRGYNLKIEWDGSKFVVSSNEDEDYS